MWTTARRRQFAEWDCMPRIASGRVFLGPSGFSCGSPSQESQGAACAGPARAVVRELGEARIFGEAQIFGGTHTNPGWTFFSAIARLLGLSGLWLPSR